MDRTKKNNTNIWFYVSYFIYCNTYIKNVSEVLKSLNMTLQGFVEFLTENKIIKQNELENYL